MVTASLKDTRVQGMLTGANQVLLYSGIYLMTGTVITLHGGVIHNVKYGALEDTRAPENGHCYKVI